jgi:hypothetical protein
MLPNNPKDNVPNIAFYDSRVSISLSWLECHQKGLWKTRDHFRDDQLECIKTISRLDRQSFASFPSSSPLFGFCRWKSCCLL